MSIDSNPYEASQTQSSEPLSFPQKLIAVSAGSLVGIASNVIMLAFLFGTIVALAGETMASPVSFSAVLESSLAPWLIAGAACTVPISVLLGLFSMYRVLKVQQALRHASARRQVLMHQLGEFRQSRQPK